MKAFDKMDNKEKGRYIFDKRQGLGITRKEFSDALGFTLEQEKSLKLWEEGKKEIPTNIFNKIISKIV